MKTTGKLLIYGLTGLIAVAVLALIGLRLHLIGASSPVEPAADSGALISKDYRPGEFDSINIDGFWELEITRGDVSKVRIEAPENFIENLAVTATNGELSIEQEQKLFYIGMGTKNRRLRAEITLPVLRSLKITGGGDLHLSGMETENLKILLEGAGSFTAKNSRVENLTLDIRGAASVDMAGCPVTNALVDMEGAGSILLNMEGGRLSGSIEGAGSLEYTGSVLEETINTSGFASVEQR
ncbi:MAG: DUF2807 domain-containing protein [Spirochaetales bacterium]|nr:DUF2807 domain-containing protein [Spirochaetales bacterium]MCF7937393.1 DUF2807 domain-containing protein [Spirochaetales bacterium]